MSAQIGKLEKIPLQDVWAHEAQDFTPWLAANVDVLGEALGMQLKVVEAEKPVGSFSLDILAEDGSGEPVVIENQLYKTDHDHLGKVLTYMTNLNAKTAIWISSDPRPEHIRAMAWLNEASPQDIAFYLVRVEAYRIGDSPPAPVFSRIVEPSFESKEVGQKKEELAQRHLDRKEFWTQLLALAKTRSPLHANISPGIDNWVSTSGGVSGIAFNYVILMNDARVEVYIDRGAGSEGWTKAVFDRLISQRDELERKFGSPLIWERLDDRRACRISYLLGIGGLRDRERWPTIQQALVSAMIRFHEALSAPTLDAVRNASQSTGLNASS